MRVLAFLFAPLHFSENNNFVLVCLLFSDGNGYSSKAALFILVHSIL